MPIKRAKMFLAWLDRTVRDTRTTAWVLSVVLLIFAVSYVGDKWAANKDRDRQIQSIVNNTEALKHGQKLQQKTLDKITDLGNAIRSCTTPQGKCAKRGQEQQQAAIGALNEITYHSAGCQLQYLIAVLGGNTPEPQDPEDFIRHCVANILISSTN